MVRYCTFFDAGYAAQGVALIRSIRASRPDAEIWVLCLDEATVRAVASIFDRCVQIVRVKELEEYEPRLLSAREERSRVEYLFTLSPILPRYVMDRTKDTGIVIYVDADMWFFDTPDVVVREMGDGNVLVVEHGFPEWLKHLEERGKFNVGILCFRNNDDGRACLEWWSERCLEWCRDVVEPGRYADQKYLDRWPELFSGVRVCRHPGINVAPWNWMTRKWSIGDEDGLIVDHHPLVVFHYAALRFLADDRIDSSQVEYSVMPRWLRNRVYGPYIAAVRSAANAVGREIEGYTVNRRAVRGERSFWKTRAISLLFGPVWTDKGGELASFDLGLGQWSGRFLAAFRKMGG